MRTLTWWLAGTSLLAILGCSGGGSTPLAPTAGTPDTQTPNPTTTVSTGGNLGSVYNSGVISTSALAIYTVEIDPATLQATSRLKETRSGAANDDLYMLSIDSFLTASSFKITGVSADTDNVVLDYLVTHPFPAPSDPAGTPNGSTNRADLGVAGMVLFLADVPSATGNTYFTDRVANTALVSNADAYYSPGGLITSSATANTFPFKQLVDESADPRADGVSNGGDTTGNFGSDGWTRSEFGAGNNGWTGYGVMHQGQSVANSVALDKGELSGGFSLDVAIVAKYNDPRGGATPAQKKANRLPPAAADAALFAYRMPHGALDGSEITVESEPAGFIANTISAAQISLHVVDWDARGTETTEADLSDDASFTNVAVGESGTPTVEICVPDVLGDATTTAAVATVVDDDSAYGGDAGADNGGDGDALFYSELVTKAAGTGQAAGDFTGMVRVTDPETGLVIGLDPALAPLGTPPDAITYQAFTVTQLPDNAPPTATVALTSGDPLNSGTPASVSITAIGDADSDNLDISVDWGNGGGFVSVVSGLPSPYANQTPSSPNMNNADLTPDTINVVVRLDDGTAQVDYPLSYTLGPNRAPQVTGTPSLVTNPVAPPAIFNMAVGTATAVDPEGDAVSYTITNNVNSDVVSFAAFPNAANTTPFGSPGGVNFTVYANDALHPTTSGTAYPVVAGTVANPCPPGPGSAIPGGANIAGWWPTFSGSLFLAPDWFYWGGMDFAGWKTATYPGWITQWDDNTVRNALARVNFTPPSTVSATQIPITGYTNNAVMYQMETNVNNRVFWTSANVGNYFWSSTGPAASAIYAGTTYLQNIYWADYSGGASVTFNTISTAPNRVMAMTVDHAGNILWIDENNMLRKFTPSGASTYAASASCGFPANLGVGSTLLGVNAMNPAGVGDLNRKVHDLVVDENNGAILILAQSQGPVVLGTGNGFLYRIERDMTFLPTVNGNANPRRFVLNTNTTQSSKCDITIDNYNGAGALLTGQQDHQIITSTSGNTLVGDAFDIRIWRSDLALPTFSLDTAILPHNTNSSRQLGMDAIGNRLMVTTGSYDVMGWYTGLPAGWQ